MINVLYVVSRLRSCGPTTQLHNIVRHLDRQRFNPIIVTLSPETEASDWGRFQALDIDLRPLNFGRISALTAAPTRIRTMLSDLGPNVVLHSQDFRADCVASLARGRTAHVVTVRNEPARDYTAKFGPLLGRTMAELHLRVIRRAPMPIACSRSIGEHLKTKGISARVIQNGVDLNDYAPVPTDRRRKVREMVGATKQTTVVVSIGTLGARKDPVVVIEAFLKAFRDRDGLLLLVGDGPLRAECEAAAGGDPRIRFLGFRRDVVDLICASDIFVSAAHSEGLPNAVLEAMALGLPVCLSSIAPHDEILSMGANAGRTFRPGDVVALSKALSDLAGESLSQLGANGHEIVRGHFSAELMSHRYQTLYEHIVTK